MSGTITPLPVEKCFGCGELYLTKYISPVVLIPLNDEDCRVLFGFMYVGEVKVCPDCHRVFYPPK